MRPGFAKLIRTALWLGAILAAGYHLALEVRTLDLSEPMGIWDTDYVAISREWPAQYQWGGFVEGHDNYGPGYPAFCRVFLAAVRDPYLAHRLANLAALAGACGLLAWLLAANGGAAAIVAALVAIFYALNAGSFALQARPDFLAALEILGVLALGQSIARRRWGNAVSSIVLGLAACAAYLTKPYALFAWGAVASHLVFFSDRKRAFVVAGASGAFLAAGVCAYSASNPLYFMETFRSHVAHDAPDAGWFVHQCLDFATLAFGPLLIALAAVFSAGRRGSLRAWLASVPGYWAWAAALGALALVCGMGWHTGAYLTYFLHLVLPPLAVLAGLGASAPAAATFGTFCEGLLLANLAVLMALAPAFPRRDRGWEELRADVLRQPGRVLVDSIMEPFSRERSGLVVAGTGMTDYALAEPFLLPPASAVVSRARAASIAYTQRRKEELFGSRPVDAIYLDCTAILKAGPDGRGLVPISRSNLPYLTAREMQGYVPVAIFRIHPYYGATNERRQDAGTWETNVLKLVRKPASGIPRRSPH